VVNAIRAVGGRDVDDTGQRNHFPTVVTGLQQADILSPRTIGSIGLHHHAVGTTEQVEVVHIERTQVNLQGLVDVIQLQSLLLGTCTVHLNAKLWNIDAVGTEATGQSWCLRRLRNGGLRRGKQGVIAEAGAVLDLDGDTA